MASSTGFLLPAAVVSRFPPSLSARHVDSRLLVRSPQDFKGFWESRFGGKKEPEQNGHANGEANGSVRKRTSDLAVYEQFEQKVVDCGPRLVFVGAGYRNGDADGDLSTLDVRALAHDVACVLSLSLLPVIVTEYERNGAAKMLQLFSVSLFLFIHGDYTVHDRRSPRHARLTLRRARLERGSVSYGMAVTTS